MSYQILVPFSGPGEGIEELSWGQRSMWLTIQREGQSVTMGGFSSLPEGTTLRYLVDLLAFCVRRHPALRTRLRFEPDGSVRQQLFSSGRIPLEVVEAGERDPELVAAEVRDAYRGRAFDYTGEWPLREAVICRQGVPTHLVAVYLHVQIDALGLQALVADLGNMDPETGQDRCPPSGLGPLEQARWQRTPAARRQSEASLRHLERVLMSVPLQRFGEPVAEGEPAYPMLVFRSRALRLAVRTIASRIGMDTSPILLGLYATAVARVCGTNPFMAILAVSNRFRPGLASSVSKLAQVSPCLIDVADASLAEVFGRARRASVAAYKNAYYDPVARRALVDRIAAIRGGAVDTSCFFSDRRADRDLAAARQHAPSEIQAAIAETTAELVSEVEEVPEKLYLSVDDVDEAIVLELTADVRYFPPERMRQLLDTLQTLAVAAACDPAATTGVRSVPVAV